ncbi:efflux RND transporter permease subunit [Myxococcota bacterium]|nr:efflux RND transporter permease subunit [Myxococcota bacterium]
MSEQKHGQVHDPDVLRRRYERKRLGASGAVAAAFQDSKLTPLLVLASLILGFFATSITPREEEPQIVVPMVDVFVQAPGLSAAQVEQLVATPMEKLLWEIPGLDDVYTTSRPNMAMAILRFDVGEDEEDSLVKVYNKLQSHMDRIPIGVAPPLVRLKGIDDVPVFAVTLHSSEYDAYTLRQVAGEVASEMKKADDVSETTIIGGLRRQVRIELDPSRLAGHSISPLQVFGALGRDNKNLTAGSFDRGDTSFLVRVGEFFSSIRDVEETVVAVYQGRPVYVRDVARVVDGPEEVSSYVFHRGRTESDASFIPEENAVTIAVAKRKGANATALTKRLEATLEELRGDVLVSGIDYTLTRDYGESAEEKSNELIFHMLLATVSVVALIGLFLGIKEAAVVLVAVPVTLALTLFASYFFGYTLNRVTLFALIFAIGILVDDAIVVVENIHRHFAMRWGDLDAITPLAVDEVGNPTILATLTVIFALMPLAFVSGMMGPYMSPIPINASAAMVFSLLVAFVVTPWMSKRLLAWSEARRERAGKPVESAHHGEDIGAVGRAYYKIVAPMVDKPLLRSAVLTGVVVLLFASMALVYVRAVKVKMLPHDNKSELQVVIDTPEGSTLERTAAVTRELASALMEEPTIRDLQLYVGTSGPMNFNGLVRHYFLRQGPNVADIQVNFVDKHARADKSHDIAKRLRPRLQEVAQRHGATVIIAEVPPGPPVLSTMVAEIYGPDREGQLALAGQIRELFERSSEIVDTDWYVESPQQELVLSVDKTKAAMSGVTTELMTQTLGLALYGQPAGLLHGTRDREPVEVMVKLGLADRSSINNLADIRVHGAEGRLVPIRETVRQRVTETEPFIYHKNLRRVVYVVGEVGGEAEAPVYAMLDLMPKLEAMKGPDGHPIEQLVNGMPSSEAHYSVKWDGEWQITYEVFRDMGIAFAIVLVLMYMLIVAWFKSFVTPIIIMLPIPLTLVGILPGHWLTGTYFTATSMIGFIALAGIIVRNSILLVDFIEQELDAGTSLREAVLKAGAIRFRPIFLTGAALVVGGAVILLDPIFSGLAVSLIFGVIVSTLLTLVVIPLSFYIVRRRAAA